MQPDKLRRLIEMRSFPAVVNQIQREADRTSLYPPTEEEIAEAILENVPLIDVKQTPWAGAMQDLYENDSRGIEKIELNGYNEWYRGDTILARATTPGTEPPEYQIRPSLIDEDLRSYEV